MLFLQIENDKRRRGGRHYLEHFKSKKYFLCIWMLVILKGKADKQSEIKY